MIDKYKFNKKSQNCFLTGSVDDRILEKDYKGSSPVKLVKALKEWIEKNASFDKDLSSMEESFLEPSVQEEDLNVSEQWFESKILGKEHVIVGNSMLFVKLESSEIDQIMSNCDSSIENLFFVLCDLSAVSLSCISILKAKGLVASYCFFSKQIAHKLVLLNQLSRLKLSRSRLDFIPCTLPELSNLKKLDICHNDISDDNHVLSKISSLVEVNLSFNVFCEVPKLHKDIERLNASHCLIGVIDNTFIKDHPNLENLDLSFNKINQLDWENTGNLKNLVLSHNRIISTTSWVISSVNRLHHIDLSNNHIDNMDSFESAILGHLTSLNLSKNKIKMIPASIFRFCPKLKHLNLFQNKISAIPKNVSTQLTLRTLILGSNKIVSIPDCFIPTNNNIELLDIHRNPLKKIPRCFYNLNNLKVLDVSRIGLNNLDGEFCKVIKKLFTLRMTGNNLSYLPDEFRLLTRLRELQLGYNFLRNVDTIFTGESSSLEVLNLNTNKITSFHSSFKQLKSTIKTLLINRNPLSNGFSRLRLLKQDIQMIFNIIIW